jgi:hypothetical protein
MFRRYLAFLFAACGLVTVFATPALAAAPTVSTGEAKEVKRATAVLKEGTVNPEGSPSTYYFEYGPEACDVSASTCGIKTQAIGPLTEPVTVEPVKIERLKPGTTYHYWIVAGNAEGATHGTEATFSTSVVEPKEYVFEKDLEGYAFVSPWGLALNQATGDVYVSERLVNPVTIKQYSAAGTLQSSVTMPAGSGEETRQLALANTANAEQGDVYIADQNDGVAYKFDPNAKGELTPDATTPKIPKEGEPTLSEPKGVAVDSSGDVYIAAAGTGTVSKFSPTGEVLAGNLIAGLSGPFALAVDTAGNIYVAGESGTAEYTPAGVCAEALPTLPGEPEECKKIDAEVDKGVAVDGAGDLFVSTGTSGVHEYGPAVGHPAIENPELDKQATEPRGLAVNDVSHDLYVTDLHTHTSQKFKLLEAKPAAVVTEPATQVNGQVEALNGTINPGGEESAEYYFEYGTSPCDLLMETCGAVAVEPSQVPVAGEAALPVAVRLDNLAPNTTYHYWLVGVNERSGVGHGEEQTFTTGSPSSSSPSPAAEEASPEGLAPPAATAVYPLLSAIGPVPGPKASTKPRGKTSKPKACKRGFERKHGKCVRTPKQKHGASLKHKVRTGKQTSR